MDYELRKLTINDGADIYKMLQEIPKEENGFINSTNGRTFEEYKKWLIYSDNASKSKGLEDWMVPTNIYWLYDNGVPVGIGKLRYFLTDKLKQEGGHIGYAIKPSQRGKGYGTLLLKLLIEEAKEIEVVKLLLTIRNSNEASIKVALNNNGKIENINDERHYIWIDC